MSDNITGTFSSEDVEPEKSHATPDHCKICRDEETFEEPLFTPCKCIGSIGKIHEQCLYNWIIQKLNINDIDSYIKKDTSTGRYILLKNIEVKCDICRSPYTFKTLYKSDNIKDLSWGVFLAPLWKKLAGAVTFSTLLLLVGLIVLIIVPNYWILLRNFLESIVNSFFNIDRLRKGSQVSVKQEDIDDIVTQKSLGYFLNRILLNSYKGVLDIVFVGLVALSIYFSQDLINSEYIFKEMLLQKMGHVDIIDLKKITVPYTYQLQLKCFQLLKNKFSTNETQFDRIFCLHVSSLRSLLTEMELEALILKSIKSSSAELTDTMAKNLYHISKEFPATFSDQLERLVNEKLKAVAPKANFMDFVMGNRLFDDLLGKPRPFDDKVQASNSGDSDHEDEHDASASGRDLFLHPSSGEDDDGDNDGDDDDDDDENSNYEPGSDSESSQAASDDEDINRLDEQVDMLLNQLREDVALDAELPQLNNQAQPNDDDGGFNMLTIRFSFKSLPKYCLIGCGVASVVLFLGFAVPYFLGRVVLSLLRFCLQFLKLFALQIRYKEFSLGQVVDTVLQFLEYENHPTLRRVVPCCVFFIICSLFVIAYVHTLEVPPKPYKHMPLKNRSLYKNLFHIKQLLKTYIIISIELLVFPIVSGMMIDASFIAPLLLNQNSNEKVKFLAVYELLHFLPTFVKVIAHAAIGTIYMLSMATFIGMIRSKILRNGVLYFVRSPEDPNRKILRDCLATSFRLQFRKLAQSLFVYMGFIFGGFGLTTRLILPTIYASFNKTKPLVSFFVLENKITLIKIVIFGIILNLCYLSFNAQKQKAAEDLTAIWRKFFEISCKRLRLSHYILNDSNIDERGIIVYRNWYYKFFNSTEAEFSNLELYTEPKSLDECKILFKQIHDVHCYFVPNGDFYRVPGSDILSTKFIRKLFVVVTKTDKVIHTKEVRPKIGHRGEFDNLIKESENFDRYDVIYCPPNFFKRSIALLIEVNIFAIFFIVTGVLLCNFIGQFIIYNTGQLFFGEDFMTEFNKDGVYFEFVCLGFAILLDTIYRVPKTIEVLPETIKKIKETDHKAARIVFFLVLKYMAMLSFGLVSTLPFNYLIFKVFGDWKNTFAIDSLIKSSVIWVALNLFSMIRPHALSFVEDGEDEPSVLNFVINNKEGPILNMLIPSFTYNHVARYSPDSFLPEIVALASNLNIRVFVKLYVKFKAYTIEAFTNKSLVLLSVVVVLVALIVKFSKYLTQLRRNYENEILFEARILQNAEQ